jgi:hypothetical protein
MGHGSRPGTVFARPPRWQIVHYAARASVHGEEFVLSPRLHKLGALIAAVLIAAAAVPPAAASAAPAAPELNFAHIAVVPGGPAKLQDAYYWDYDASYTLHDVTVVVDASKLAGVAVPDLVFDDVDDHCSAAGTIYTCAFDSLAAPDGFANLTDVSYQAADGAKPGAEGTVSLKVSSRELGAVTRTAKITVAEGVSLTADGERILERSAKPGTTVAVPLGVRNEGPNPITGVDLFFFIDPWYGMAKHYSNCEYGTTAAYCHFDGELRAGTAYGLSEPMGMLLRKEVPAPSTIGQTYNWLTPADNRDNVDLVTEQKGRPGTDGVLTLEAKPAAQRKVPQSDTSQDIDWQTTIVSVTGTQKADLAAIGAEVEGGRGSTVTATVGVENLGPAFAFGYPDPAAEVTVTAPKGTTVVFAPNDCTKAKANYVCTTTASPLDVGAKTTWPFKLRIDQNGTLTGKVSVKAAEPDGSKANDTADLVVTTAAGSGDGGADNGGGGGGPGGGLPTTGGPVMTIFGVGALLLVGGAAAYLITRRRRSRFVA